MSAKPPDGFPTWIDYAASTVRDPRLSPGVPRKWAMSELAALRKRAALVDEARRVLGESREMLCEASDHVHGVAGKALRLTIDHIDELHGKFRASRGAGEEKGNG